MIDERALTEQLVAYDTSTEEGLRAAAGFVVGWLEARDVEVETTSVRGGLPVLMADTHSDKGGGGEMPTLVLHGHLDVVPAREEQFEPRVEADRLYGRGAYDMKGALAAMMLAFCDLERGDVRVRFGVVPDEESEEEADRGSDALVAAGCLGDFAITGEPTDMHIGVEAKGVLAVRLEVTGRSAHGSTPWLGENAILRAIEVFRAIESLPFARQSSELFDRPSLNLGRILGGDALNKVPDRCVIDIDIRHLPEQAPAEILSQLEELEDASVIATFTRPPAAVDRDLPYVRALAAAAGPHHDGEVLSVGRDGASDVVSFLRAGVPAVEFGPVGGGHHGPDEWVSLASLAAYRKAIGDFVREMPAIAGSGAER